MGYTLQRQDVNKVLQYELAKQTLNILLSYLHISFYYSESNLWRFLYTGEQIKFNTTAKFYVYCLLESTKF